MTLLIVLVAPIVMVRALTTLWFLLRSLHWLAESNSRWGDQQEVAKMPCVHILIPALREQKRILPTLDYFQKLMLNHSNSDLIVVTTKREFEKAFEGPSTFELVDEYLKKNRTKNIHMVDSPYKTGIKAHQLNYVLNKIDDDSFIVVYDADSRPHPETLDSFYKTAKRYPHAKVFQQSAIFFNNYRSLKTLFLKASSILQSRWTLTHELSRLLRQSVIKNPFLRRFAYAHVVGHGLIIDTRTLKAVGGFPEYTITEDLFLGYLLRAKGFSIFPLPLLESADAPKTISGLWNQKYVWFFGPLKTFSYLHYVRINRKSLGIKSLLIPASLTLQGFVSAVAWLSSGPMVLYLLVTPLITHDWLLILFAYLSITIYGPLQYFITLNSYRRLIEYAGNITENLSEAEKITTSLMSIPAILFNSLPPYFALSSDITAKLKNQQVYKPKTDD